MSLSISSSAGDAELLLTETVGGALLLRMNRPEAGNSVSLELAQAMARALREARRMKELRAVIITGAGGRFFCTGGDLKAYSRLKTGAQMERTFGTVRKLLDQIEALPLPVIAAIDGMALGGGAELALACDLRIASAGSRFGFPQARLGLIPGWNGTERLVETVGRSTALRLLLTAERLAAAEAEALGLIDILAEGSAVETALGLVRSLEQAAPLALGAAKQAVMAAFRRDGAAARRVSAALFKRLWLSEDHREAERAFIEKRPPRFAGR